MIDRLVQKFKILFIIFCIFIPKNYAQQSPIPYSWMTSNQNYESIECRFKVPQGFKRVSVQLNSFAQWLRGLPLLPDSTAVMDYLGNIKMSVQDTALAAVINYSISGKKLEQCMDILYRFRAEYLLYIGQEEQINFFLPGDYLLKWNDWQQGFRPKYKGIDVSLKKTAISDSSRQNFEQFLWEVFYNSYTQTAYYCYPQIEVEKLQIGDFIVKKGRKGHAVMILDMARDEQGNKLVLVGQGDTPARNFCILNYKKNQPWVPVDFNKGYLPLPIKKKMMWDGLRRF